MRFVLNTVVSSMESLLWLNSAVDAFSIAVEVSSLLQPVFPTFLAVPAFVGVPRRLFIPALQ